MPSWASKLAAGSLLRSDDGRVVFYPYGSLRGYVVAERETQRHIVSFVARLNLGIAAMAVVEFAVLLAGGIGVLSAILIIGTLLNIAVYCVFIRRLTQRLTCLPVGLGFRFYARWCDEERLWIQLIGGLLTSVTSIALLAQGLDLIGVAVIAYSVPLSVMTVTQIRERQRQSVGGA